VFAAAVLALGLLRALACAQDSVGEDNQSLNDARKALNGRTSFPFYDAQQDDVKRMDVRVDTSKPAAQGNQNWTKTGTTPAPPINKRLGNVVSSPRPVTLDFDYRRPDRVPRDGVFKG
jgi:hypothetical protein